MAALCGSRADMSVCESTCVLCVQCVYVYLCVQECVPVDTCGGGGGKHVLIGIQMSVISLLVGRGGCSCTQCCSWADSQQSRLHGKLSVPVGTRAFWGLFENRDTPPWEGRLRSFSSQAQDLGSTPSTPPIFKGLFIGESFCILK